MENERMAVEEGFNRVFAQLNALRLQYLKEIEAGNTDYEGINGDDVVIWFIEGLS